MNKTPKSPVKVSLYTISQLATTFRNPTTTTRDLLAEAGHTPIVLDGDEYYTSSAMDYIKKERVLRDERRARRIAAINGESVPAATAAPTATGAPPVDVLHEDLRTINNTLMSIITKLSHIEAKTDALSKLALSDDERRILAELKG